MPNSKKLDLNNVQILRAIAAISVVLHHAYTRSISYGIESSHLKVFGDFGQAGVDLFFVISGFILVYAFRKNEKSAFHFLKDRYVRIAPVYYIVTVVLCVLYLIIPDIFRNFSFTFSEFFLSVMFLSQLTLDKQPILGVGWTLEYEMFFYLVFFLSISFRRYLRLEVLIALIIFGLVLSGIASPICLEFLAGVILYVFYKANKIRYLAIGSSSCFVFVVILIAAGVIPFDHSWRVVSLGVGALSVLAVMLCMRSFQNPILLYLGEASYSIYLVHDLALSLIIKINVNYMRVEPFDWLPILFSLLAIAVGVLFYEVIEKPTTRILKK